MQLNYESAPKPRSALGAVARLTARAFSIYFVLSSLTLPFIDSIWIGELPVLALVQVPKTLIAGWLRTGVVMPLIGAMGLSRGSFSPDYALAGPYALIIAYLMVVAPIVIMCWRDRRVSGKWERWMSVLIVAAVVDFVMMLMFSRGPGLTIY